MQSTAGILSQSTSMTNSSAFSSPAGRWARKTISEKDMENVSIFHGGDEFSVQVGFTKYELTAAGDFVGAEALVPPTVAETDDAKTDPAMPDIVGVWMFFSGLRTRTKSQNHAGREGRQR
ncbi:MAG: hypothetical protein U0872_16735 [Planctomycetaceae bacterium]